MMPFRLRRERRGSHAAIVAAFGVKPQTFSRTGASAKRRKILFLDGGALPRRRYGRQIRVHLWLKFLCLGKI
jgi:hypothetical protein